MMRTNRFIAGACALAIAGSALPALAQYATEYRPPKLLKAGTASHDVAGSGTVKVHVLVGSDGKPKCTSENKPAVLSSTNSGNNAAAIDIACSALYTPARRGSSPTTAFYDYNLHFNGKSAAGESGGGNGATAGIESLVRAGKYKDAIAKANAALLSSPGDPAVLQLLGVAQYYDGDLTDSAATFSRVQDIRKQFQPIAAQAFATGSVRLSQSNPAQSLDYAHKAVALSNGDATSKFALGVAQLANKQNADAVTTLKSVHDQMMSEPKADAKTKLNVDQELLQAYLANNDAAGASAIAAEMKSLDPAGAAAASQAMSRHYLQLGSDAMNASDFPTAAKNFDLAASSATGQDAVTANTFASFAVLREAKPDYSKARDYAQKAVAGAPDDAQANYALGLSYYGVYQTSQKGEDKTQALNYLNKSDQLAKAAGNEGLALQIEAQIKNIHP